MQRICLFQAGEEQGSVVAVGAHVIRVRVSKLRNRGRLAGPITRRIHQIKGAPLLAILCCCAHQGGADIPVVVGRDAQEVEQVNVLQGIQSGFAALGPWADEVIVCQAVPVIPRRCPHGDGFDLRRAEDRDVGFRRPNSRYFVVPRDILLDHNQAGVLGEHIGHITSTRRIKGEVQIFLRCQDLRAGGIPQRDREIKHQDVQTVFRLVVH